LIEKVLKTFKDPFLKIKKAVGFLAPTALMIEIPNDHSMGAPRVGIMCIILLVCVMERSFVFMKITIFKSVTM